MSMRTKIECKITTFASGHAVRSKGAKVDCGKYDIVENARNGEEYCISEICIGFFKFSRGVRSSRISCLQKCYCNEVRHWFPSK